MKRYCNHKGFTLIELLMVAAIMGLVMVAVYSLYLQTQRTAYTSEEVVDTQQNLRVALDSVVADLRMAGFLLSDDIPPINTMSASLADSALVLNAQVSTGSYARATADIDGTTNTISIDSLMGGGFRSNDSIIAINPITLAVTGPVAIADNGVVGDSLKMAAAMTVNVRDMILRVAEVDDDNDATTPVVVMTSPVTISYSLIDDPDSTDDERLLLQRSVTDSATPSVTEAVTVAATISAVTLEYFDSSGNVTTSRDQIQAVRVTITAKTEDNKIGQNKTRQLQTVVNIRNNLED